MGLPMGLPMSHQHMRIDAGSIQVAPIRGPPRRDDSYTENLLSYKQPDSTCTCQA